VVCESIPHLPQLDLEESFGNCAWGAGSRTEFFNYIDVRNQFWFRFFFSGDAFLWRLRIEGVGGPP
jgi:hypothetical protein